MALMLSYSKKNVIKLYLLLGVTYGLLMLAAAINTTALLLIWRNFGVKADLWFQFICSLLPLIPLVWIFTKYNQDFVGALNTLFGFEQGERGEKMVYQQILKLRPNYYAFRNIYPKQGKGDVDIVVVSQTGIFALEVKNYSKRITLETNLQEDKKQARTNAAMISDLLEEKLKLKRKRFVAPILVFAGKHHGYNPGLTKNRMDKTLAIGYDHIEKAFFNTNQQPVDHKLFTDAIRLIKPLQKTRLFRWFL